jgi:Ca2+-binding EF-hand superfamily protein
VEAEINKVFAEFDDDRSGFIDKKELKIVASTLGVDMNASDL